MTDNQSENSKVSSSGVLHNIDFHCVRCRSSVSENDIHHIVPVADGGTNTEENLIVLCSTCYETVSRHELSLDQLRRYKTRAVLSYSIFEGPRRFWRYSSYSFSHQPSHLLKELLNRTQGWYNEIIETISKSRHTDLDAEAAIFEYINKRNYLNHIIAIRDVFLDKGLFTDLISDIDILLQMLSTFDLECTRDPMDPMCRTLTSLFCPQPNMASLQEIRRQLQLITDVVYKHQTEQESIVYTMEHKQNSEGKMSETKTIKILFLAADPTNASRLRLGEEFREIQEKLKLARLRGRFKLELPQLSIRPADVTQALLDIQPQIVHFSGHGTASGILCFEDQIGEVHPIQPDALAALFGQFADQVSCVILNACYSDTQAMDIGKHIDYVVGMNQAIGDKAAIAFAIGFYQALGAGRTVEEAYRLGCIQIRLQNIPEHLTPVMIKKGQVQP